MSEVAGRLPHRSAPTTLMRTHGGRGVLMVASPAPHRPRSSSSVAAWRATTPPPSPCGMGARVTVFDLNINTLRKIDASTRQHRDRYSSTRSSRKPSRMPTWSIARCWFPAPRPPARHQRDGLAHEAGRSARRHRDRPGWRFEDSRRRRHDDPTFAVHDTVFYCVANMPARCRARRPSRSHATSAYVLKLADKGWQAACKADPALAGACPPTRVPAVRGRWPAISSCPSPTPATLFRLTLSPAAEKDTSGRRREKV